MKCFPPWESTADLFKWVFLSLSEEKQLGVQLKDTLTTLCCYDNLRYYSNYESAWFYYQHRRQEKPWTFQDIQTLDVEERGSVFQPFAKSAFKRTQV